MGKIMSTLSVCCNVIVLLNSYIVIYSGASPIRHTKGPGKCVGLYRMSEPVQSDTTRDQGNVWDCTGCQNLSNQTHQGTREMCRIVQDVRTCLIRHTKGPGKCVALYRMSEYFWDHQFLSNVGGNSGDKFHCNNLFICPTWM